MEQPDRMCQCGCGRTLPPRRRGVGYRYFDGHSPRKTADKGPCAIPTCDGRATQREWCQKHYLRWKKWGDPEFDSMSPEARFGRQTSEGPVPDYRPDLGPCLIFRGATNSSGYGQFRYNGRNGYAHRYAWERINGAIPKALQIDHLCRVRTCVNVAHLELVDGPENTRRAAKARDVCLKGHPLTEDSTLPGTIGACAVCRKAQVKRSGKRRTNAAKGLPNRRIKFDQALVRSQIADVRAARSTIAQAAREIGCNPNYLGRRVWEETKADVIGRDGMCVRCGAAGPLDVQHRKARGRGGTSNPETSFGMSNLIALCRPCHEHVETHRVESRRLGYSVPQWQDPALVPVAHWRWVWAWPHPDGEWVPAVRSFDAVSGEGDWLKGQYAKSLALHRGIEIVPPGARFQRLCSDLHDAINDTRKDAA